MARIYPLFSSSSGNCIYFGDAENGILIDCGVSCRRACTALAENGIDLAAVKGLFITHTHSDHIAGVTVLMKKLRVPLYAQRRNIEILSEGGKLPEGAECIAVDDTAVTVGGFEVKMFRTSHDAPASCGYRVTYPDGKRAALCTDLGIVTDEVRAGILGCDLVLLESNYDPGMLRTGPYPYLLRTRIDSDIGHLSNAQCGETLRELAESGTRSFVLGHISPENNTPALVESSAAAALSPLVPRQDYMLYIAAPEGGGAVVF